MSVRDTDTPSFGSLIASPTAHTFVELVDATPRSVLSRLVFGVGTTDHLLPFQCCASVESVAVAVLPPLPTAHTSLAPLPVTALSSVPTGVTGVDSVQVLPLKCSTSELRVKSAYSVLPTAHTLFDASAVTAFRPVVRRRRPPDGGTGIVAPGTTVHVVPSKWRRCVSRPLLVLPTAQMSDVERPPTPLIAAQIAVGVVATSVNALPLKRVVNVRPLQPA